MSLPCYRRVLTMLPARRLHRYTYADYVAHYRTIPTLREYIIVSHRERRITVHARDLKEAWTTRSAISGGQVRVESLGTLLVVDEIYRESTIPA